MGLLTRPEGALDAAREVSGALPKGPALLSLSLSPQPSSQQPHADPASGGAQVPSCEELGAGEHHLRHPVRAVPAGEAWSPAASQVRVQRAEARRQGGTGGAEGHPGALCSLSSRPNPAQPPGCLLKF